MRDQEQCFKENFTEHSGLEHVTAETPKTLLSKNLAALFIIARGWNRKTLCLRLSNTIADLNPTNLGYALRRNNPTLQVEPMGLFKPYKQHIL